EESCGEEGRQERRQTIREEGCKGERPQKEVAAQTAEKRSLQVRTPNCQPPKRLGGGNWSLGVRGRPLSPAPWGRPSACPLPPTSYPRRSSVNRRAGRRWSRFGHRCRQRIRVFVNHAVSVRPEEPGDTTPRIEGISHSGIPGRRLARRKPVARA